MLQTFSSLEEVHFDFVEIFEAAAAVVVVADSLPWIEMKGVVDNLR